MANTERGGFYSSQDADINLDDDGDYFTWTLDEAREALNPAELEVATFYWDIGELGDMHHNPAKNVLHRKYELSALAADLGRELSVLEPLLTSAKQKLLAARAVRTTPFIDRTLYTGWNAMAVSAFLEAARTFHLDEAREFALRTHTRLLAEAWDGAEVLQHVIAYNGDVVGEKIPGTLDDYAFTIHASMDAWMASGEMSFYRAAVKLADAMIARFFDRTSGAFLDTAQPAEGAHPLGALQAPRKPLQDSPTPAGNPTAASALLRLEALSGRKDLHEIAEDTLASFAGIAPQLGLYAGSYALALERFLLDPVQISIIGAGPEAAEMEDLAISGFNIHKTVIRVDPELTAKGELPEALAETLRHVPIPTDAQACAIICKGRTCLPPITTREALLEALRETA
jgi:uncharacterized protein